MINVYTVQFEGVSVYSTARKAIESLNGYGTITYYTGKDAQGISCQPRDDRSLENRKTDYSFEQTGFLNSRSRRQVYSHSKM